MVPVIRLAVTCWTIAAGLWLLAPLMFGLWITLAVADTATERWRTSPFHAIQNGVGKIIPCRCRHKGGDVPLGTLICMNMPNGTVMARCDMELNNTSWVPTDMPCNLNSRNRFYSVASNG
jgi:hypothetical protein